MTEEIHPSPPPSEREPRRDVGFFRRLVAAHPAVREVGAQRQAELTAGLSLIIMAITIIAIISIAVAGRLETYAATNLGLLLGVSLITYILTRLRFYRIGGMLLSWGFAITGFLNLISAPESQIYSLNLFLPGAFIIASVLISLPGLVFFILINSVATGLISLLKPEIATTEAISVAGGFVTLGVFLIIAVIFRNVVERLRFEEISKTNLDLRQVQDTLEERVAERSSEATAASQRATRRAKQLEAISEVAHAITLVKNIEDLLPSITQVISERFGYYHVGIFLLDEKGDFAILQAANSEGGLRMLARGHRLQVGHSGIVGYVTSQAIPRIALDVGEDAVYFDNPDLPDTRSEMALPLMIGEQPIGALDVQSTAEGAFTQEDLDVMKVLADQVALAIENSRLFTDARKTLETYEKAYRQFLGGAWARLVAEEPIAGYRIIDEKIEPITERIKRPEMLTAVETGEASQGLSAELAVPLKIRGEVIGVLNFHHKDKAHRWSSEDIADIQVIADRVAVALENARLLEDSLRRAENERAIADITGRMRETLDMDTILQTALKEIHRSFDLREAEIRLGQRSQGVVQN